MSFNTLKSENYINIKLTDEGRHQLSLGRLKFHKLVFSDREVDYSIDSSNNYTLSSNRILSPNDAHPNIDGVNLDGTNPIYLNQSNVTSLKQFITGSTLTSGHFSGTSNNWTFLQNLITGTHTAPHSSQSWGANEIKLSATTNLPSPGSLIFCSWLPPQNVVSTTYPTSYPNLPNIAYNGLFYGVISGDTSSGIVYLDRPIPNFTNEAGQILRVLYYPNNAIETSYGSGSTLNTPAWNMNIIRTYDVAGTNINTQGISGFTQYGSIQYAGTRKYFGFSAETPAVGIIHYTNEYTGNTFGEQLIEKTVEIHMPFTMWHKVTGYTNGNATSLGLSCYDYYGNTIYDPIAKTTYRELRDGISSGNTVIGKVYHKLKMFVILPSRCLLFIQNQNQLMHFICSQSKMK